MRFGRAVVLLFLLAVLSTAGLVHYFWQQTANRNVDKIVAELDAQVAATVRGELAGIFIAAEGTVETARSIFFQGAIKADDEAKREFIFLALLRAHPALSWIGFGFPDGRFFGAHATDDDKIEMLEIGAGEPGSPRPLRRDVYSPIPGDIMFEDRIKDESAYVTLGAPWYRAGKESDTPLWTDADVLPNGFEPAIVSSNRLVMFGNFQGVIMTAVGLQRLSGVLAGLGAARIGEIFLLRPDGTVLATSATKDGTRASNLADFPADDVFARAAMDALRTQADPEFHVMVGSSQGSVYISANLLPFNGWRLVTAIPRSVFADEIDRNTNKVLIVITGLTLVAAATAVAFANFLFARPIRQLAEQLVAVERFDFDGVRRIPSPLTELDDLSAALQRMAAGLRAFARFMPLDIVRPLVTGAVEPKPGGDVREISVLFADLPGFTELTERLGPGVEPHLTAFLTVAVEAVHREGGTVDKFIGDAVMAIWNAPGPVPDHALRACRAAAAIREAMHAMPSPVTGDGPRVRIGINTGTALVGNVGSEERLSYTAIGDTVNLASRLVGVAKDQHVEIVLSKMTHEATGARIRTTALGETAIRGRTEPVDVYALN
nr:adenylate/guanylate cyclase domain-containing protein [Hartmannibacter diazotrophicus]